MNILCRNLLLATLIALLTGCSETNKDYEKAISDPALYRKTVRQLNKVVLENIFAPPVASRNYVYANIAAYETIIHGDKRYKSLSGVIKHLPKMPQPDSSKVYNYPYAALYAFCKVGDNVTFSQEIMADYIAFLKRYADSVSMPHKVQRNSIELGESISKAIIEWSKGDNYLQTRGAPRYTVRNDLDYRWIPTPPAYEDALEPHWGKIRLMIIDSTTLIKVPAPPPFNMKDKKSAYYKEIDAVKKARENLTEDQKHMAEFWDDIPFKHNVVGHLSFGTKKFSPPGHWMNINEIASARSNADFSETVYGYMVSAIALYDAFICCWHEKYTYNTVRPETVINKYLAQDWQPLIQTPPFPEYTCGHSTISAAAAEVLTNIYGDNFSYIDSTEMPFGIKPRSFKSFRHAAEENLWGRFYGGIHLHSSCVVSNQVGTKIGNIVAQRLKVLKR